MDITVTRTGKTFYQVDSAAAALLVEAFPSHFERVMRVAPPRPTEPQWGVGRTAGGQTCIVLDLPSGEKRLFVGTPDEAATGFKYRQWDAEKQEHVFDGPVPPPEIIEHYRSFWTPRPVT